MSKSNPSLLDLGVLLSLVALAVQYFMNYFGLPWLRDHTSPDTYAHVLRIIRVALVLVLGGAGVLGLLGYMRVGA